MKKKSIVAMILLLAMTAGCGNSYKEYEKNVIKFEKDGGVTETIREAFDESIYNKDDLVSSIEEELSTYNEDAGTEAVSMEKCRVKNGEAVVEMQYRTSFDYAEFNHVAAYVGAMADFVETEYHAYADLKDTEGTEVPLNSIVASKETYYVAAVDRDCIVEVPGTICYVSSDTEIISKKAANVTVGDEAYAYIVYK